MTISPDPSAYDALPADGWPTIPVVGVSAGAPQLVGELVDPADDDLLDEVLAFYRDALVPQLACSPDGTLEPWPQRSWVQSPEPPRVIVAVRDETGVLRGCWILKDLGSDGACIYYPVATIDAIAAVFRALWDETIRHFDYVWGDTSNPVIMAFAQKAVRVPPTPGSPTVTDSRLEWRRRA